MVAGKVDLPWSKGVMRLALNRRRHLGALATLAACALVASCGTPGGGGGGSIPGFGSAPSLPGSEGAVKVAVLLPITSSGSTPAVAKALKQAAELALFDFDNPNVVLVPKDTRGSAEGARMAAESAAQEGAELIIGPLFAQEVSAAAPVARRSGIPMIAFSSDEKVAGNGVYLLSFVAGRDVPRIVSFAMSRGKRNFAVLVPQSPYGRIAEEAFARAVGSGGGQAPVRATFSPNDSGAMASAVQQVANAGSRVDALFLPAGREELPALGPVLASSGLTSAKVQFIGTGQWDFPNVASERALIGGWYPAPNPKGWSKFVDSYAKTYGAAPPRIASLAYDAVSLAVSLSQYPRGERYSMAQLTRSSGFAGVDGLFRLLPDGTAERGLAILEVRDGGPRVIDPAPSSFSTASSYWR
jgi:ABC-type branched-subunit amino acid transport system substrate-binding protein